MSSPVVTVGQETSFADTVQKMVLNGIGNLAVVNGNRVLGVVTERELLHHLVLNKTLPNKQIKDVLTHQFAAIPPETSVLAASKMISKKVRLFQRGSKNV